MCYIRETVTGAEYLKIIGPLAGEVLARHVLSIFALAPEHEHLRPIGTGALLQIADRRFLITAAHVASEADKVQGDRVVVGLPADGRLYVVGGKAIRTPEEHTDLAIVALSAESHAALNHLRPLSLADAYLGTSFSSAIYALSGYPREWYGKDDATRAITVRPYQIAVRLFDGDTTSLRGYDSAEHVLMTYGLNTLRDDPNGVVAPQSLRGLSGSSIWRLADLPSPSPEQWSSRAMRVVGIQTGEYRIGDRMVVKATRWASVVGTIAAAFPELRPPIMLHGVTLRM
jgi:hypothetical protein